MKLELGIHHIQDLCFASETSLSGGRLNVNRADLEAVILEDPRLATVGIELALPGQSLRIIQAAEVVEPRAKVGRPGFAFPGAPGGLMGAGSGKTRVLRGSAVVVSEYTNEIIPPGYAYGEIIDMSGPGAKLSPYGSTVNLVLTPGPSEGVNSSEYQTAAKCAALKAADYLASANCTSLPDEVEEYHLPSLPELQSDKPKVGYIFQVMSTQFGVNPFDPVLYGGPIHGSMPVTLHPNEVLDGALLSPFRSWGMETYAIQNHPVIKELYRKHNRELLFVGVILMVASENILENERSAILAARTAKYVLGADGVILTKSSGGAPEIPMAMTARQCEQIGLKTVAALWHIPATGDNSAGVVMFSMPEVDGLVSMGTPHELIVLPQVDRVLGRPAPPATEKEMMGEIRTRRRYIRGAQDQLGGAALRAFMF